MIDIVYTICVLVLMLGVVWKAWQTDQLAKRERRSRRETRRRIQQWTGVSR